MAVAGRKGAEEVLQRGSGRCFGKKNPLSTPGLGGSRRFHGKIHLSLTWLSVPLCQELFRQWLYDDNNRRDAQYCQFK